MKRAIASVAMSTFLFPFWFSAAANGCADADYVYSTINQTENQVQAAAYAKDQFCSVLAYWN